MIRDGAGEFDENLKSFNVIDDDISTDHRGLSQQLR